MTTTSVTICVTHVAADGQHYGMHLSGWATAGEVPAGELSDTVREALTQAWFALSYDELVALYSRSERPAETPWEQLELFQAMPPAP